MVDSSLAFYKKTPEEKSKSTATFANLELINSSFEFFNPLTPATDYTNMSIIASNSTFKLDCIEYYTN